MKTKLFLTLFTVLFYVSCFAQSVSVGARLGVNFATVRSVGGDELWRDSYNDMVQPLTGMQFGMVTNIRLNEMFSLQPELLYAQKGVKIESPYLTTTKARRDYLELPILGKLSFGTDKIKGFIVAGPYAGYWIRGNYRWKSNYADGTFTGESKHVFVKEYDSARRKDNRLDVGASIGAGIAYTVGSGTINLEARYGYGLSDDKIYEDGRYKSWPKRSNRVVGVSVAYLYSI